MTNQPKQNAATFTRSAKVGVTMLSFTALLGVWNGIGHREASSANAQEPEPNLAVLAPTASMWPTIVPLPTFQPIPTLMPLNPIFEDNSAGEAPGQQTEAAMPLNNNVIVPALPALNPLPTLAPLPAMPAMPEPPPPPPPSSSNNNNNNNNGGGGSSQNDGKTSGGS